LGLTDQYRDSLLGLFPPGAAWAREAGSKLYKWADGFAYECARIHSRALEFFDQVHPETTTELLSEWEAVLGLPDACTQSSQTIAQRRAAVVAKLSVPGGNSPQFYIDMAAALGFTVTITDFEPFQVGRSVVGDALTNGEWQYAFQINAPTTTEIPFRVGTGTVGEALAVWGNDELECRITAAKPAHAVVLFVYS